MNDRKKVLITDRFSQEAFLTLEAQPYLDVQKTLTPDLKGVDLKGVHALVIRSVTQIKRETLQSAPDLQLIVTATSGFDHIDLDACKDWGVTVMHTPSANIESASQLTWALVLACTNKICKAHREIKLGTWNREMLMGTELAGKTYGIVGLGRIGKRVAEIAQVFGMNVLAYDPYLDDPIFREAGAERHSYEELLKQSDVMSYHVPKTKETHYMFNRALFDYTHSGLIVINTSRGTVVKEQDLVEALEHNWIAGAGLDVFEREPLQRASRLIGLPNVVLTPHIGASTTEAFAKASELAALKVIHFFVEGVTSDTLPPKASWYGAVSPWDNE